ncbi:MAG: hypothetical protein ACYDHY_18795 [Acidiferrobacterales bacterium]
MDLHRHPGITEQSPKTDTPTLVIGIKRKGFSRDAFRIVAHAIVLNCKRHAFLDNGNKSFLRAGGPPRPIS